jgi:hypothetical protein
MKERSFQLAVALILSAALHIGFVAHLSGLNWFGLARPDPERAIDVALSSGDPQPKKEARPSAHRPFQLKQKKIQPSAQADSPTVQAADSLQEQNADAPAPDVRVSGKESTPPSGGGEKVAAANSRVEVPGPAAGVKTGQTRPPLAASFREKLLYDISWAGIHVGQATLEASNEGGDMRITSRVRSAAVISLLYKVEDFSESHVVNGLPAHFRIRQHEGKYRSDKDTVFDSTDGRITFYNYRNGSMEEHAIKGGLPWDVLSGFYYLRTVPLVEGKTVLVDIFDSGKFLKVAVNVIRKEKVEVRGVGQVEAVMVRLLLQSDGLFKSQGDVNIWLTDDDRRIPVRVQTKVPIGSVTAELSSMERGS